MSRSGSNTWNDGHCDVTRPFVCECDPDYVAPRTPACRTATSGFVTVLGRRYFPTSNGLVARDDAEAACTGMGAYLFSPADLTENAMLHDNQDLDVVNDAWLGLAPSADGTSFVWDDDAATPFTNWVSAPPAPMVGSCPFSRASDSRWDVQSCGNIQAYACECDPEDPK